MGHSRITLDGKEILVEHRLRTSPWRSTGARRPLCSTRSPGTWPSRTSTTPSPGAPADRGRDGPQKTAGGVRCRIERAGGMSRSTHLQSDFISYLLAANPAQMDGFKEWVFQAGMRFQALEKWWDDQAPGSSPMKAWTCIVADVSGRVKTSWISRPKSRRHLAGRGRKKSTGISGEVHLYKTMRSTRPAADNFRRLRPIYHPQGWAARPASRLPQARSLRPSREFSAKKPTSAPRAPARLHGCRRFFRVDQLTWKNLAPDPGITLIDPLRGDFQKLT